jgi:ribosomal protein S18 acetylase RimI-like enzyme
LVTISEFYRTDATEPGTPHQPSVNGPSVRRLAEADWRVFAELRLQALTDTLGTFDVAHREESAFTAAQWRRRLRTHAQFAAYSGDEAVGLIAAQREHADSVYLYSLWLAPTARGRGFGEALLHTAVEWARGQRARTVTLRVQKGNKTALRVYERAGFQVVAGATDCAPDELTMALSVG